MIIYLFILLFIFSRKYTLDLIGLTRFAKPFGVNVYKAMGFTLLLPHTLARASFPATGMTSSPAHLTRSNEILNSHA